MIVRISASFFASFFEFAAERMVFYNSMSACLRQG
jgi:hypothetical protein